MRRHLVLLRHAKSSWDDPTLVDHDRPLAPRGENALPRMCDHLASGAHRPQVVLCSSARRTVATLEGIRPALPDDVRVEVDHSLYHADGRELLDRLHGLDEGTTCAMMVGHNPSLQDLALLLADTGDSDLRQQLATKLPTGAIVALSFDGAWAELGTGEARLDDLFLPRRRRP
jgi:phosphohistidine phosphatase